MRLDTITYIGNAATVIAPAIEILKDVRNALHGIMPNAEHELNSVMNMLNEIIVETGQPPRAEFIFEPTSEETKKILKEAALVVEERMKEKISGNPSLRTIG